MAGFSDNDVRNELARIFRGHTQTVRYFGVTDSKQAYSQVKEIINASFLLHPESVYYLSKLVSNRLTTICNRMVSLLDDMLSSLDLVGRTIPIPRDTTSLSNAYTALLSLDTATSVKNRPELTRFSRNIEKFANGVKPAVVSDGEVVMTGEEARLAVQTDFAELEVIHPQMVQLTRNLAALLDNYTAQDIPSKVAAASFANIRESLQQVQDLLTYGRTTDIDKSGRAMLLRSLASQSAVSTIATSEVPSTVRYRGPTNPYPGAAYTGRVAGSGMAASVTTLEGPWELPLTTEDLIVSLDGGAAITADLSELRGASVYGRNSEPFVLGDTKELYVTVDPEIYSGVIGGGSTSTQVDLTFTENPDLGYRHLGAPIWFPSTWDGGEQGKGEDNPNARYITELPALAAINYYSFDNGLLTVTVWGGARHFVAADVGRYIRFYDGINYYRYEVALYVSEDSVVTRAAPPPGQEAYLHGTEGVTATIEFSYELSEGDRDMSFWAGETVLIGPTVKTVAVGDDTASAAVLAASINSGGPVSTGNYYEQLGLYCLARESPLEPGKLVISDLSSDYQYLQISPGYWKIGVNGVKETWRSQSMHGVPGFLAGEQDSGGALQVKELATYLALQFEQADVSATDTQVTLASKNSGRGSSIRVLAAPAELDLPSSVQYGSTAYFEAVDNKGNTLDFSKAVAGDFLSVLGGEAVIARVTPGLLELATYLPASLTGVQFEILSYAAVSYTTLKETLEGFLTSRSLLKKYKFDESLDELDAALSPLFSAGSGFQAGRQRARVMIADLRTMLAETLLPALHAHSAPTEVAVDNVINTLSEGKHDRAVDLLLTGEVAEFFDTTDESASYASTIVKSIQEVSGALPVTSSEYRDVQSTLADPEVEIPVPDPEKNLEPIE